MAYPLVKEERVHWWEDIVKPVGNGSGAAVKRLDVTLSPMSVVAGDRRFQLDGDATKVRG
jgi:hypothetical protein